MADFARKVAEGGAAPQDRFGRPLRRGQVVTYQPLHSGPPVYEVIDVAPILDPRQVGLVKVTLATTLPLRMAVNDRVPEILIIDHLSEINYQRLQQIADAQEKVEGGGPAADAPPTGPMLVLTDAPELPTAHPDGPTIGSELDEPPPPGDADTPPEPVDLEDEHAAPPRDDQ